MIRVEKDMTTNSHRDDTDERAGVALVGVSKSYGPHRVVDGVDLSVRTGEFVTLLGPSGSGKTTCLNMIAGFTPVTEGEVLINGRSVTSLPAHKRDLGVVFQNYALFPHLTVAENIEFPLRRRGIEKATRQTMVREFLEMVQLAEHAPKMISELSGGQQQRVALARALVYKPSVLLMDEPLGALDKKLREWLQLEIKRIHEEVRSTFLFVTHDQEEALSMSDRIAVFNDGRIAQFDTGQELYRRPRTLFVGQFLGESTVIRGPGEPSGTGDYEIRVGDDTVRATAPKGGSGPHVLFLRPEQLALEKDRPSRPSTNSVAVRITGATYLGADWKFQVRLPNGDIGTVRSETLPEGVRAGADAFLTWSAADGIVLADV